MRKELKILDCDMEGGDQDHGHGQEDGEHGDHAHQFDKDHGHSHKVDIYEPF